MTQRAAPYGTWSSPITAEAITKGSIRFADIVVDSIKSTIYHIESRPSEEGRNALVNTITGIDVVGKGWNVRTGVQEYGGAAAIVHDGVVYFSHYKDGRVYRVNESSEPEAITPESPVHRFAGFAIHPVHTHLLVAILEDHTALISGADFYASAKFSPDGTRLTWIQWCHPDMPWEGSEVHTADVTVDADGMLIKNDIRIAGKASKISGAFPSWASNDTLIFTSDETDYINPWKYANGKSAPVLPKPVAEEFGKPFWQLHMFPYAIIDNEGKFALFTSIKEGRSGLHIVDLVSRSEPRLLDTPYVAIDNIRSVSRQNNTVAFEGEKVDEGPSIVQCTISDFTGSSPPIFTVLKPSVPLPFPKGIISVPRPMTLKASSGDPIHVVYYPPQNSKYSGSSIEGELPPCVLNAHGGPTSLSAQGLNWKIQYFTSRGWAWLDVNYGGSSGYGRHYIDRLTGKWGIVDVQDCIEASRLISTGPNGLVDPKRIAIRGGSAGGYTVLAAIANGPDVTAFAAGTSSYGISDLKPLADDTHKFESHYLFKLIGGTFEEVPDIYKERSPIYNADNIIAPLLILQGELDRVVPKEQAELIYDRVKARGGIVEYELYPGEGHGWRQEKNIKDALEREIKFYEDVLSLKK